MRKPRWLLFESAGPHPPPTVPHPSALRHRLSHDRPTNKSRRCCRGATLKTRKRNITVPLDPGSFADAVVTIFDDAKEPDASVTQKLQVRLPSSAAAAAAWPAVFATYICVEPLTNGENTTCPFASVLHTAWWLAPQAGVRVLESVELDFSRYGDTLFEVLFAGGRLAGGGNVVEEGKKLDTNVRAAGRALPLTVLPGPHDRVCFALWNCSFCGALAVARCWN